MFYVFVDSGNCNDGSHQVVFQACNTIEEARQVLQSRSNGFESDAVTAIINGSIVESDGFVGGSPDALADL